MEKIMNNKKIVIFIGLVIFSLVLLLPGCNLFDVGTELAEDSSDKKQREQTAALSVQETEAVAFPGIEGETKTGYYKGIPVTYELIEGKAVFDFDIVVDPSEVSEISVSRGAAIDINYWPNRVVNYHYDSSFTNTANAKKAVAYMNDIGFYMTELKSPKSTDNYINFIYIDQKNGYWSSSIGMSGGKQEIHLANGYGVGTAIHEIGHAIGLYHEQSRTDRSTWITIQYDNIEKEKKHNFDVYGRGFNFKNFDWLSVMLYPSWTGFEKPKAGPAITLTDGTTTYSVQGDAYSIGDLKTIYQMYPHNKIIWSHACSTGNEHTWLSYADKNGSAHYYYKYGDSGWDSAANITLKDTAKTIGGGHVSLISRATGFVDFFMVDTAGNVRTAKHDKDTSWGGWWTISGLKATPGDYVAPVSRGPNILDVLVTDNKNGHVYCATWNLSAGKDWSSWRKIGNHVVSCGTEIAAVIRDSVDIEAFSIGTDGEVYNVTRNPKFLTQWGTWRSLGSCGKAAVTVEAVASAKNRIHVFAVTIDQKIYSNELNYGSGWTGWKEIGDSRKVTAQPGAKVKAVSRKNGYVDIFVMSADGQRVYTASWQSGRNAANTFTGWNELSHYHEASSQVAVVSDNPDEIEYFALGRDNGVRNLYSRRFEENKKWTPLEKVVYHPVIY